MKRFLIFLIFPILLLFLSCQQLSEPAEPSSPVTQPNTTQGRLIKAALPSEAIPGQYIVVL